MAKQLTWDDAEDIGILLSEAHPTLDPLADIDLRRRAHHIADAGLVEGIERGHDRLESDAAEDVIAANDHERHRILQAQHLEDVRQRVLGIALRPHRGRNGLQLRHGQQPGAPAGNPRARAA